MKMPTYERRSRAISLGLRLAIAAGGGLALFLLATPASAAPCKSQGTPAVMFVTADCEDPLFNAGNFVIDGVTQVAEPRPHTKVTAHFNGMGTGLRYNVQFYLPPADKFQGRFYQHVYPLPQKTRTTDIEFALANGSMLVNLDSLQGRGCEPEPGVPTECAGFRPDAATAKMARAYAATFYKTQKRIYGYVWGGSGGSEMTLGMAQNTDGVWDGALSYIMVLEGSGLGSNAARALGGLALASKMPGIIDASKPGGSGDIFAGLNPEQSAILAEALNMGSPRRTLDIPFTYNVIMLLSNMVVAHDPTYVEDFWTKPGYEGANPPAWLTAAKVDSFVTITDVARNADGVPTSVTIDAAPTLGSIGANYLETWVYAPDGKTRVVGATNAASVLTGNRNTSPTVLTLTGTNDPALLKALVVGGKLRINNRLFLALNFYHRHTIAAASRGMHIYDQYRGADGKPLYPQRALSATEQSSINVAGGTPLNGHFHGKLMVSNNLMDDGAHAWQAAWYADLVRAAMGPKAFAESFRVYLPDNAMHQEVPTGADTQRVVRHDVIFYQELRDLADWVEKGIPAPPSTHYAVSGAQVTVPPDAAHRGGIQPVVTLTVGGTRRIDVAVGQPVTFKGRLETPPHMGLITKYDWYFGGTPFAYEAPVAVAQPRPLVDVEQTHSFATPGTYFVTLRAYSQRNGTDDPITTLQNLDRVRVVVH